jgi:hypothetical protein
MRLIRANYLDSKLKDDEKGEVYSSLDRYGFLSKEAPIIDEKHMTLM